MRPANKAGRIRVRLITIFIASPQSKRRSQAVAAFGAAALAASRAASKFGLSVISGTIST